MSPTSIKVKDEKEGYREVTDPGKLAELFNDFFKKKVDKLREKTNQPPQIPPAIRLQEWLSKRSNPVPPFHLTEINREQFREILKKMKQKRTSGVDHYWKIV